MIINITKCQMKDSERKIEGCKSIAEFTRKLLMPRQKNLEINLEFVRNLHDKESIYGDCYAPDEDHRPRTFNIRIMGNMSTRRVIETMAHEMVHVRQYAQGHLRQYITARMVPAKGNKKSYRIGWNSEHRWYGKVINTNNTHYFDLPWEIEAHGREVGLFVRWCEAEGIGHLKWTQDEM